MYIRANHSFPGHIGNDYKLTLANGKVLDAIRIEGLPVNEDFDRHGDWVSSPYQVIFPAISEEEWNEGAPTLSGSVCHEPVSIKLWLLRNEELKRPAWEDLKLFKTKLLELAPDYAANFKNPL